MNIIDPPRRKNSVFIGGSLYGKMLADSEEAWISKAKWEEEGPTCVHRCV